MNGNLVKLRRIHEKVSTADGPDKELDAEIHNHLIGWHEWASPTPWMPTDDGLPGYTSHREAALRLVERMLPGWWWKIGTCSVSDDACVGPDFNSPVHCERLRRELSPVEAGSEFDCGFDVDRRPPGNMPLALLESLLMALIAIEERSPHLSGAKL